MTASRTIRRMLAAAGAILLLAGTAYAAVEVKAPELRNREQVLAMLHNSEAGEIIKGGFSGYAEVLVEVDARGRAGKVRVVRPTGRRIVDRELAAAASRFRFVPAMEDGTPVRSFVTLPFVFGNGITY